MNDDNEPVTHEWLASIGLGDGLDIGGGFQLRIYATMGAEICFEQGNHWSYDYVTASTTLPEPQNRGDVRRLNAALPGLASKRLFDSVLATHTALYWGSLCDDRSADFERKGR